MSIIPKIAVSRPTKRSKSQLSFDCSTSANIGDIQPTMARLMCPMQTNHVKVNSLVRLASMPLPTFGRMHLKHYHAFVPYSQLWEPMTSFLSAQRFSALNTSFIPTQVPRFLLRAYWAGFIRTWSYVSICDSYGQPVVYDPDDESTLTSVRQALVKYNTYCLDGEKHYFGYISSEYANFVNMSPVGNTDSEIGCFVFGNYRFIGDITGATAPSAGDFVVINREFDEVGGTAVGSVDLTGADYIEEISGSSTSPTYLCYKFHPYLKHLRKIVIGLGYQFTPYHFLDDYENIFKLLAYYKTWFEYFRPIREKSFTDTTCYSLIKYLSERNGADYSQRGSGYSTLNTLVTTFLRELMTDTFYYLPMDYFAMATTSVSPGNSDIGTSISTPSGTLTAFDDLHVDQDSNTWVATDAPASPIAQKLALRLLNFTNKNTVIGRSIREYIRVHFGVFEDAAPDSSGITRIGVSDVNVQVSDVMSTAPSEQGYLGEYGGKGIGYGDSETFDYTAKEFGVWLTLSVIVPQSGYYQGTLKENFYKERFDFFTPEFDALGYQVLERRELMDSYCANGPLFNPSQDYDNQEGFGFVPRYSDIKVGRNIVNGDLSINGQSSMRPYFFDRRFSEVAYKLLGYSADPTPTLLQRPSYVPSVVFDGFRMLDPSDHFGQYNRIFNVTSNWVDHFVIHNIFEVTASAPWKSLNDSFDTFVEGEDTINVIHS